ncbi:MAG: hypothetical protein WAP56_04365, partial [Acetivibrionales bacterium]
MRNSKKLIALVLALSMLLIGLVLVVREAIIRPAADGTVDEGEQPQGQELDDVEEAGSPGEGTDEDESTGRIPVDENGFDAD